jgi:hypothetical protein
VVGGGARGGADDTRGEGVATMSNDGLAPVVMSAAPKNQIRVWGRGVRIFVAASYR